VSFWQFVLQNRMEMLDLTLEHLWLVGASILIAMLVGIPLGILITRWPKLNKPVLGGANVIQTIPSLALFGFLLPAPWIGARADRLAILALTLYALLPLIRNTYTGIKGVDRAVVEAARGMGMTDRQILFHVELPLAMGVIIAGVRVAAVITIGLATIAAAIGAGGLGEFIFRGLAMVNNQVILAGAIPAALMALLADTCLGWLEKRLTPYNHGLSA
jgi:osmoprotectant transport system permease protein